VQHDVPFPEALEQGEVPAPPRAVQEKVHRAHAFELAAEEVAALRHSESRNDRALVDEFGAGDVIVKGDPNADAAVCRGVCWKKAFALLVVCVEVGNEVPRRPAEVVEVAPEVHRAACKLRCQRWQVAENVEVQELVDHHEAVVRPGPGGGADLA